MTNILPKSVTRLIEEFSKLPGIGPKSASRLTFYLLNQTTEDVGKFGQAVDNLKEKLRLCEICFNISEDELCPICSDKNRDLSTVLVVAEPLDVVALERTGYKGAYHILGGVISPIDGIGPEDLRIKELLDKLGLKSDTVKEVIIATNPSLEGEATALYLARRIDQEKNDGRIDKKLSLTRIARGLPMGGDVEYADEITLTRALEGRKAV